MLSYQERQLFDFEYVIHFAYYNLSLNFLNIVKAYSYISFEFIFLSQSITPNAHEDQHKTYNQIKGEEQESWESLVSFYN